VGELVNEELDVDVEVVVVVVVVTAAAVACTFVVELEDTVNVEKDEGIVGYDQKYRVADEGAVRYLIMDLMMLNHEQLDTQLTDDHERKSRGMRRMTLSEEPSY
jgi:hypothetical protein